MPRRPAAIAGRDASLSLSDIALLATAVIVPLVLFVLVALDGRREAERAAFDHVERTARILESHALDVLDVHRMALESVEAHLRGLDWSDPVQRAALGVYLSNLQDRLRHVATIIVTDRSGGLRIASRGEGPDPKVDFSDRDWFRALERDGGASPYVSGVYVGRLSGMPVFNVAMRVPSKDGGFDGAVAVSVDRSFFSWFYRSVDGSAGHDVALFRDDGQILTFEPPQAITAFPAGSRIQGLVRSAPEGTFVEASPIDGVERFYAYRRVGSWPVFVCFGLSRAAAFSTWYDALSVYGVVAFATVLLLLGTSWIAVRRSRSERSALRALETEVSERRRAEGEARHLQKMDALGHLTGGIAHDFNNMLAVVVGGLDMAERRLSRLGPEGIRDAFRHIEAARGGADRAAALTRRLLAFSRRQALSPQVLDPGLLVRNLDDLVRRTIGETIDFEVVVDGDVGPVEVDSGQLENVVVNLAVNARDAMPAGGRLRIRVCEGGSEVLISVSDTGSGMDEETASRAFDPFFTTKEVGKGTGLGLSQAYGFARQSGGSISIRSRPGTGTVVELRLPHASSDPTPREAGAVSRRLVEVEGASGTTVLVVEDDERVRAGSVAALLELGFRVVQADCGARALEVLGSGADVDVVFTDVVMPGMTGVELAGHVRRLRPDMPVVFTSGHASSGGREAILPEGATLVPKPFSIDQLADGLRGAVPRSLAPVEPRLSLVAQVVAVGGGRAA